MNLERFRVKIPERVPAVFYAVFFLASLALFFLMGFPSDSVERRITYEIRRISPVPVFFEEVRLVGLSGVELKNVSVDTRSGLVKLRRVRLGAKILPLVFSDVARISFSADAYRGKATGKVSRDLGQSRILGAEVNISSVESSELSGVFLGDYGVSLSGRIDGTVQFSGDGKEGSRISRVDYGFYSDALSVAVEEIMGVKVGIGYENLSASLQGTANRFETKVEKFSLSNEKFSVESSGKIPSLLRFRKSAPLNLSLDLNLLSEDRKLELLGSFLGRRADGSFSGKISGTLSEPKLEKGDGSL